MKKISLLFYVSLLTLLQLKAQTTTKLYAEYPPFKSYMLEAYWTEKFEIDSMVFHDNKKPLKPVKEFEGIDNLDKAITSFHSFNNSAWYKKLYTSEFYEENADIFDEILATRLSKDYSKNAYYKKLLTIFFIYDSKKYAMCITESYFDEENPYQRRTLIYENSNSSWLLIDGLPLNYLSRLEKIKLEYLKVLLKNTTDDVEEKLIKELKTKIFINNYLDLPLLEANVTSNPFDKPNVVEKKKQYAFLLADFSKPEPLRDEVKLQNLIEGFVLSSNSVFEYFESNAINFKPFVKYVKILKFDTPEDALASLYCHDDPELYKKYTINHTPQSYIPGRLKFIKNERDTINSGLSINFKVAFTVGSIKYVVISYIVVFNGNKTIRRYDRFIEKYDFSTNKRFYVLDGDVSSHKIEKLTTIFGAMNEAFLQCLFNNVPSDSNYPRLANKLIYKDNKIDICNFYYIYEYESGSGYFKNVLINLN